MTDIRRPAFAGMFYPAGKAELTQKIDSLIRSRQELIDTTLAAFPLLGGIVPHAGFDYSGMHAVYFFAILAARTPAPETVVILNPNHRGVGPPIALDDHHAWETPFGYTELDKEFREATGLPVSRMAHDREHSGEVMLPFLQYFLKEPFRIVAISLMSTDLETTRHLAGILEHAVGLTRRRVVLIASSDFSHFLSPEKGAALDDLVLKPLLARNLVETAIMAKTTGASICGLGPILTAMDYAQRLDPAYQIKLLSRGHSGQVAPSDQVVQYLSAMLYSESPKDHPTTRIPARP